MKKIFFLASALFIVCMASAQTDYVVHTIKDGETLTQLANKYGTTVGDIMRLNKMTTDSKLSIGEEVKIPAANTDTDSAPTDTIHTVAKGETLYSIAHKNHLKVAQLREWNNISDNIIKDGQVLRLTPPNAGTASVSANNDTSSAPATTADNDNTNQSVQTDNSNTANQSTNNASTDTKQRADDTNSNAATVVPQNTDEGVFSTTYQSLANGTALITKGSSGIFKSSSGWQDKKYYILMNDIAPGTIVKVQANGKTVYAKVLWNLGNVQENTGLTYRISDAAASQLNLSGDTFDIIVSYFKTHN